MSATDELRRMLDERGVEYTTDDGKFARVTRWDASNGRLAVYAEYSSGELRFAMDSLSLTPEQAIAATLGRGECQATMHLVELEGADGTVRKYRTIHYDTECGGELFWPGTLPPYCPYCRRRVKGGEE